MNEWMKEWMDEWINGWMNEWFNEWMNLSLLQKVVTGKVDFGFRRIDKLEIKRLIQISFSHFQSQRYHIVVLNGLLENANQYVL